MVIPLIMAGVGALSFGYGLFESFMGRDDAEEGLALQQQGYQFQRMGAELQYDLEKRKSQTSRDFAAQEFEANKGAAQFSRNVAQRSSEINTSIINTQFDMERQRQQGMELDARRQQMEIIRNQQRARALAVTNATSQGAQGGSGLQGGYGQISGQSNVNALGVQQSLDLGRNMFNLNAQLAAQRKQGVDLENVYAFARADQQTNQANMMYNYAQLQADYQTQAAGIQTNYMSHGQGLINQGGGVYAAGQSRAASGASFMQLGMNIASMGSTAGNLFNNFATPSGFSSGGMGLGYGTGRLY